LKSNELFLEAMRTRIIRVLGIPIDTNLAIIAAISLSGAGFAAYSIYMSRH
jgi:hypothetical protein